MSESRQHISGQVVDMTPGAVMRWNSGCPTTYDLRASRVWVGHTSLDGSGTWISLRRATNHRLEPQLAAIINDQPVRMEQNGV